MPMAYDQPDNAARLARLGVGAMLAPRLFTGPRVAGALGALLDSHDTADACARWRDRLLADDAVDRVCDLLEELKPERGRRPECGRRRRHQRSRATWGG